MKKSKRTVYTACHLEPEVKEALQEAAERKDVSVSAFISEAVEEKLEKLEAPAAGLEAQKDESCE